MQKLGTFRGKQSIHVPHCAIRECQQWHPVGYSRAGAGKRIAAEVSSVSQLTNPFDNCKGMGWIITILVPTLLLKTFVVYFRISCFILLDQSLSYPCTRNVPRLGSASLPHGCVQQWHSTQVSAVFGSWLCHSCPQTHWTWAGSPHQLVVSLISL